jgi:hypothetical protein
MKAPDFEEVKEAIERRIKDITEMLAPLEYEYAELTAKEFYNYLKGEIFTPDNITFRDIIGNEYLMVHKIVEASEIKNRGFKLDENTVKTVSSEILYTCHLIAIEFELDYALLLEDYYWIKHRLPVHIKLFKEGPNIPRELKNRAEDIYTYFNQYLEY